MKHKPKVSAFMKHILKIALAAMFILSLQTLAADKSPEWKPLNVPQEITTKQEIVTTPEGWVAAKDTLPNRLSTVTIFDGPPEDKASLVYNDEKKSKNKTIASWKFSGATDEHIWITCAYSETNIIIKKQLPVGIKELRVFYDDELKTDGFSTIEKIEWR
jgi:hypothetical protein